MQKAFHLLTASLLILGTSLAAEDSEEALFVRRITEFHKDGESALVEAQIREFVHTYPQSQFRDSMMVILGDTYWSDQQYAEARKVYESIRSPALRKSIQDNYIDTLYHLKDFKGTVEAVAAIPEGYRQGIHHLYYAEALRQEALHSPELLEDAKQAYIKLSNTEYAHASKPALADLYLMTGEQDKAFNHYVELAESHPDRKAEFLLQAARLKAVEEPELMLTMLADIDNDEARFLIGRSHFALENYVQALSVLEPLASNENMTDWPLLYMLTLSAHHTEDDERLKLWSDKFVFSYPDDPALAHIWYVRGIASERQNDFDDAITFYEKALARDDHFENRPSAMFQLAILLYKQGDYSTSRKRYLQLIEEHPNTPHILDAKRSLPRTTLQLLTKETNEDLQRQLMQDLQLLIEQAPQLTDEEVSGYEFKLAQTLVDLKDHPKAKEQLDHFQARYPQDPRIPQVHLLLSRCALHCKDSNEFIKHAEIFLTLEPEHPQTPKLRLNLFSAYMQQGNNTEAAADHLYLVMMESNEPIKAENQLWLANHYYAKVKDTYHELVPDPLVNEGKINHAKKAAAIFEKALTSEANYRDISHDILFLEAEFLKLGNLYGWLADYTNQESVLKHLAQQQEDNPGQKWNLRTRTQFTLAYALYQQGLINQAQRLFTTLATQKGIDPYITKASKLFEARLSASLMPEDSKSITNPEAIAALKALKDLQIRKSLVHEPIHLEAALDYALIRSSLEPPTKQLQNKKLLLQRAKESFTCKDDLCSKEYQAARSMHPDKETIYQAYMTLIDAHLLGIEAELAAQKGNAEDAALRRAVAIEMYTNLLKEKFAVSKYLVDQARSELNALTLEAEDKPSDRDL